MKQTGNIRNLDESVPLTSRLNKHEDIEQPDYQTTRQHLSVLEDDESSQGNLGHLVGAVQGRLLLLLVAFLYGSLNVTLRLVYQQPGPPSASALSSSRGWIAAICFIPLLMKHRPSDVYSEVTSTTVQASFWRVACELALFNFGAQALLMLGLLLTASAWAPFFTQTSVVMTPILSALAGYRLQARVWVGCGVALVGLVLLSDNDVSKFAISFGVGDLFCLAGAFCWSLYLFRLSAIGSSYDEVQMQAAKTVVLAGLYSIWFVTAQFQRDYSLWQGCDDWISWALIFYSALGPGTLESRKFYRMARAGRAYSGARVVALEQNLGTSQGEPLVPLILSSLTTFLSSRDIFVSISDDKMTTK